MASPASTAAALVFGTVSSGVWAQGPLVASVLPTSRAVPVNTPATAFATIINADPDEGDTATSAGSRRVVGVTES